MKMPAHWQRLSTTLLLSILLSAFTQADGCHATDEDGDGVTAEAGDCDDTNAEVYPGAPEQCNGLDDDCDGLTDEDVELSFYTDADGDGFGDASASVEACAAPSGMVSNHDDCDDTNATVYPGAPEQCNAVDDDCDGLTDEDGELSFYTDADGDGFGDASASVEACAAPAGTVSNHDDCDDTNAAVYPGALEQCNGLDDDCDGLADEVRYYTDADGDGYGDETLGASCKATELSVTRGGDCNDANASAYPGAPDASGDGIDQSCDGSDGLAPSVGLPTSTFTTLQAAMDAATEGQTVWVGPGTYPEFGLSMGGKALRLVSTEGEKATIIDAQHMETLFYFTGGETEDSVLEGFTLTGGEASCNTPLGATSCFPSGGGIFMEHSSPTLTHLTFTGNSASEFDYPYSYSGGLPSSYGGGMYLDNSSPTLIHITFTGNSAGDSYYGAGYGGGMYLDNSSPTLIYVTFTENSAQGEVYAYGGGMYLDASSSPTLTYVTFTGNSAQGGPSYCAPGYGYGGGMYLDTSSPTLTHVTFTGNSAQGRGTDCEIGSGGGGYGYGGGMYLDTSSPTLTHVTFTGNWAQGIGGTGGYMTNHPEYGGSGSGGDGSGSGGGMSLNSSSPTLAHVTFTGNSAQGRRGYGHGDGSAGDGSGSGGGMSLDKSSPTLSHVTFTGNTAKCGSHDDDYDDSSGSGSGGGMSLDKSSPTLSHVTFTGNTAKGGYYEGSGSGGGMSLDLSSPTLSHCILAYNLATTSGGNLYRETTESTPSNITAQYALIYNPSGWTADTITPSGSYLTVEPKFLDYADSLTSASCTPGASTTCLPADLHPALGSPLINAGDPAQQDVDGSRADIGSYGGEAGDQWDVDGDGTPDYFWPGERDDAPNGFNPADYDLDDLDPTVQ